MAKFKVYHYDMKALHCSFGKWSQRGGLGQVGGLCSAPALEDYKMVAVVEADDIDGAFQDTNHIVSDWQDSESVICLFGKANNRSTSVGDIVVDMDTQERYLCASFGWSKIFLAL